MSMYTDLIVGLFDAGVIRLDADHQVTLKSGRPSSCYLDIRSVVSHPALFKNLTATKTGPISTDNDAD
jgi:orotate phosphoribosyltransferase